MFSLCNSGLKVNMSKSSLVGMGCPKETVKALADVIHCQVGNLPIYYLSPFKPRSEDKWGSIVGKVERTLSLWKRKHLSSRGRIILIKASLANILILYMPLQND